MTALRAPATSPLWLARLAAPLFTGWARLRSQEPLYTREALATLEHAPRFSHARASRELGHQPRPLPETLQAVYRSFQELGL